MALEVVWGWGVARCAIWYVAIQGSGVLSGHAGVLLANDARLRQAEGRSVTDKAFGRSRRGGWKTTLGHVRKDMRSVDRIRQGFVYTSSY